MNPDILRSYLVSLGYTVDQPQLNRFNDALRQATASVLGFTGGMTTRFIEAGAAVVGALTGISTGTLALMDSVAQSDLGMQLFARHMYMTTEAARQMSTAQKALGYDLKDILWGPPELQERYRQLIEDQKRLESGFGGANFEQQMRRIRDIGFEFTRLKVEAGKFAMYLATALSRALTGDENGLLNRLRGWNEWLINNIPQLAEKFSTYLVPVLRDTKQIWLDMVEILKDVASGVIRFIGTVSDDATLKAGAVNIENIGRALDKVSGAIRGVMDWFASVAHFIDTHPWALRLLGAGVGAIAGTAAGAPLAGVGALPGAVIGGVGGFLLGDVATGKPLFEGAANDLSSKSGIQAAIAVGAAQAGISPALALAVASRESGFNPTATGTKGDYGLFQLMPDTAKALGVDQYDPKSNIRGGTNYLSQLLKRYGGDERKALEAYNWGPGRVDSGQPVPQSVQDYATDVMQREQSFSITINVQSQADPAQIADHVTRSIKRMSQIGIQQSKGALAHS